jgi:anaerobic selenocysteine-containing dehydrogenase
MHVIFRDGLEDRDYLERYTLGADALRERVAAWTPERTAQTTGLLAADVERFAREYASTNPSALRLNYGINRHAGGGMAVRTLACLPALTGAWRYPGGGVLLSASGTFPTNAAALNGQTSSPLSPAP